MKKGIRKGKYCFFILCTRLTSLIFAACITVIFASSYIDVTTQDDRYQYILSETTRNKVEFEDSELFSDLFYESINDVTRMCVIKNQLETNGKYDGKKIVDITSYANRTDPVVDDSVTAEFYLDDLIKWGNYGFDFKTGSGNRRELVSRYQSVDGLDLSDYAANEEEYEELVSNLQVATQNLFQNYTEYTKFNKEYGKDSTNIKYCYQMINNNKVVRYSNVEEDVNNLTVDQVTTLFSNCKKFIYYNADKMQISTNTSLNAQEMRGITGTYEYSFGDNSKIWIAIDDSYANNDVFKSTRDQYNTHNPYYNIILIVLVSALVLHLLFLVLVSVCERKVTILAEEGTKLKKCDKIPLEVYLVMFAAFLWGFGFVFVEMYRYIFNIDFLGYTPIILNCFYALLFNIVILSFYLSGIRRIVSRTLFKNSILYMLGKKIRAGFIETYDNGQLVTRTWLPYLIFLCLNLVLVLLGIGGIAIAFIFDMAVGYYLYRVNKSRQKIVDGIENIKNGDFVYQIETKELHGDNLLLANAVNSIGKGIQKAVETSMKDERLKADLITNVSHDIKTPLTSIINYVDLIKRENIEDTKIKDYVDVLDAKSQRLKQLTDDLVEASKISSGNISLNFERINFVELVHQSLGEFSEKFDEKQLQFITSLPDKPVFIMADSRRIYRVIENLYNNIYKYTMERTRVYVDMQESTEGEHTVFLSIKNISAQPLNINADELTERFIRGDVSRGTEGSGLGLSIAKNLTQALKGNFEIVLDGDLFKVILTFKVAE